MPTIGVLSSTRPRRRSRRRRADGSGSERASSG
jgi:hypothetical protein